RARAPRRPPARAGGRTPPRLAAVATRGNEDAPADERILDDVRVRHRVAVVELSRRRPETHVQHLRAEIDGGFHPLVDVGDAAHADAFAASLRDRRAEDARGCDGAPGRDSRRELHPPAADDRGARRPVADLVERVDVGVARVAEERQTAREVTASELDEVRAAVADVRPELGTALEDPRVEDRADDRSVARLVRARRVPVHTLARRPGTVLVS